MESKGGTGDPIVFPFRAPRLVSGCDFAADMVPLPSIGRPLAGEKLISSRNSGAIFRRPELSPFIDVRRTIDNAVRALAVIIARFQSIDGGTHESVIET